MKKPTPAPAERQEFDVELVAMGPRDAWLGFEVPFDAKEVFGRRSRVAVRGTLNGCPFRGSLAPRADGSHAMTVPKELQAAAAVRPGSRVHVVLERDLAPRSISIPPELRCALCENAAADRAFAAIPYSRQKHFVDWIQEAKRPATRRQRVEKTVIILIECKPPVS